MLLTIDIGNTNITLGVYNSDILCATARLATAKNNTSDQYAIEINSILNLRSINASDIEDCIISSVVPSVARCVSNAISMLCDIVPLELGPGIKTGLNIKIDNPAQLGADLVAGAVGAISEYTLPCVVIDMGTASTISVIDKNGMYIGGVIAAGVRLTLKALAENTAQLPNIDISAPKSVIGTNTVDCMKSGLVLGTAAMIDGLLDRIIDEIGEVPTIVATGGLSKDVVSNCKHNVIYNENLLLDGLKEIYDKNK